MIPTTYGLCLLAALLAFSALGDAYAQDHRTILPGSAAIPTQGLRKVEDDRLVVQPFNMTVDKIHRMDVVTADGRQVGDVQNVLIDNAGRIVAVTITTGTFLGLGAKEHVMPLNQLRLQGDRFVTGLNEQQIEKLPVLGD